MAQPSSDLSMILIAFGRFFTTSVPSSTASLTCLRADNTPAKDDFKAADEVEAEAPEDVQAAALVAASSIRSTAEETLS